MEPLNRPYRNREEANGESMIPVDRQPDDLCTRIAAAIYKGCDNRVSPGLSRQAADVVIRELGLHMQYENGRVMYNEKPAACKPNGLWQQRIVSPHEPYTGD